jgi:hypothetical protein
MAEADKSPQGQRQRKRTVLRYFPRLIQISLISDSDPHGSYVMDPKLFFAYPDPEPCVVDPYLTFRIRFRTCK